MTTPFAPSTRNVDLQVAIEQYLTKAVADLIQVPESDIKVSATFDSYGLDSSTTIGLTSELSRWLDRTLDPTLLYDYRTIQDVARHLAEP